MRTLWAVILVLHLAAVPAVFGALFADRADAQSLAAVTRLAGLLGSAAFFVLKIIDLPCLRLKPGWRSTATALLIIGLLHLGVVGRAVDGDLGLASTHPGVVLFVVAIGQARIMVPVLRWYRRFSTALGQGQLKHWPPQRLGPEWSEVWVAALTPRCIPAFIGPRAPPAGC